MRRDGRWPLSTRRTRGPIVTGVCIALLCLLTVCRLTVAGELTCFSTGRPPTTPYGLDLCYMYSHNACCLPGTDLDIKAAYAALIPGGSGCKSGSQRMHAVLYPFLRYLCLPCDPDEPKYRFESAVGDIAAGGVVPPLSVAGQAQYTWRICKSFLYGPDGKDEGIWGDDASQYNTCGITLQSCLSTPYYDLNAGTLESPSGTCEPVSELVIPSVAFAGTSDPALDMLSRVAQTMPDFQFVVVDDTAASYDYSSAPCFGRSNGAVVLSRLWLIVTMLLVVTGTAV